MSMVQPTHPKTPHVAQMSGRPSTRSLLRWVALVSALHLAVLLSLAGTLDWQLSPTQPLRTGPMQTRTIAVPATAPTVSAPNPTPAARTRIALVEKPQPAPTPKPGAQKTAVPPPKSQATAAQRTPPPEPIPAADQDLPQIASPNPLQTQDNANLADLNDSTHKNMRAETTDLPANTVVAEVAVPVPATPNEQAAPLGTPAASTSTATSLTESTPAQISASDPPLPDTAIAPAVATAAVPAQTPTTPAPEPMTLATMALPEMAVGSLPPSALLSYRLNGQEKGIQYQASGELRWQRNDSAYAMSLSVKAFLLGSRHWRSVGQVNATGLAPTRFSDSWRSERAAHFDHPNQRIVFSSNAPAAALQPGAQDQVSLYAQLAAAMAQPGQQMMPGTRLQIQTATVRDALPWLLTLEKLETLQVNGQSLQAVKWVCQPRNRFDAQVEFWVTAAHDWLPARIRITQASGSFIDLELTGRATLGDLPPVQ